VTTTTEPGTGLARRLAEDLDGAFPELVRAFQDGLYSGVQRLVPAAEAEDVTQEAFVRAYRAMQGYDPARVAALRLPGWLWTIALNLCRNRARAAGRRPRQVVLDHDHGDPSPGPEDAALAASASRAWDRRLAALGPEQRRAVVLRHIAGLGYDEIAEVTGRAVGTVKSDVHRGLARLEAMLDKEENR